jgi:type II secretory pathway pseudopilin PulG
MNKWINEQMKKCPPLDQRGITSLAEIMLVVGIMTILFTIGIFSLTKAQQHTSLSSVVDTFLSDFKEQQIKAMVGSTEGGAGSDNYGIHFDTVSYTLFKGTYSASNSANFVTKLPPTIQVSAWLDSIGEQEIIFLKGDGHIKDYNLVSNAQVAFKDNSANIQKNIFMSKMGATDVK